ncbi:MAG: glucosaminidase domain-containing protein [Bacteroidales bacterium]|nr:glucosaminidase domain-containing protein [Bacteroidales bacterium]
MTKYKFLISIIFLVLIGSVFAQKMTPQQYVERFKGTAIHHRFEFGIPAAITLSQGILESGIGGSYLAVNANNHFGIKCHSDWKGKRIYKDDDAKDECFRVYNNADESYTDHALFLTGKSRYEFLFSYKITDYKKWAKGLKKAGYATNPQYPKRLIDIIEKYDLAKYDLISEDEYNGVSKLDTNINDTAIVDTIVQDDIIAHEKVQEKDIKHAILYHNRIKSIIVHHNESIIDIANKFNIHPNKIYAYNDINKKEALKPGMRLYLQPKRRRGDVKYHIVRKGENIWDISQQHGIKVKWLLKRNNISKKGKIKIGQKLYLQRNKPL